MNGLGLGDDRRSLLHSFFYLLINYDLRERKWDKEQKPRLTRVPLLINSSEYYSTQQVRRDFEREIFDESSRLSPTVTVRRVQIPMR